MHTNWRDLARTCLEGAEAGAMDFPQIVGALMAAGFDGYAVDLRRGTTAYYLQSGEAVELASAHGTGAVAERWDEAAVRAAIRDAQAQVPGYTYLRFCARLSAAGCAGYVVSFLGRRVLYFGRTAETHTEHFPRAA